MRAGAGKRAGQGSTPRTWHGKVNELPGDYMSYMGGKLPAGGRGATVRGDG